MILLIQSNITKRLYKAINICVLLFTITWVILFTIQHFNNSIIELLTAYLMIFSAPVFIVGLICIVFVSIISKMEEVSDNQVQKLILNIEQKDFQKREFTKIKPDNNFIMVQNFYHEITCVEAIQLIEIAENIGIEIELIQKSNFTCLDQNPKEFFNNCMGMLWAAS